VGPSSSRNWLVEGRLVLAVVVLGWPSVGAVVAETFRAGAGVPTAGVTVWGFSGVDSRDVEVGWLWRFGVGAPPRSLPMMPVLR
jgi:hypothetical protein